MKINPEDWNPIGVTTLEPAALESVKHNSNLLVIAGPGAGKTELLAQKACFVASQVIGPLIVSDIQPPGL